MTFPTGGFESVLEYLTGEILGGRVPPGSRLPNERELATQLGASRSAVREALKVLQAQGVVTSEAQRRAADRVTLHQVARTALPRRFSLPMQEIWLLQPRFSLRQRKRVFRLLSHPRFRAAFDFLELRLVASESHAEDVAFWREAQRQSGDELAAALDASRAEAGEGGDASAPRKRRRRRRRSGPAAE